VHLVGKRLSQNAAADFLLKIGGEKRKRKMQRDSL
jgi:hypothetical protein